MIRAILNDNISDEILKSQEYHGLELPTKFDLNSILKHIDTYQEEDSPSIFGLNQNADIKNQETQNK